MLVPILLMIKIRLLLLLELSGVLLVWILISLIPSTSRLIWMFLVKGSLVGLVIIIVNLRIIRVSLRVLLVGVWLVGVLWDLVIWEILIPRLLVLL